jgi:hypothetical protein
MNTEKEINSMIGDVVAYGGNINIFENNESLIIKLSPENNENYPLERKIELKKVKKKYFNEINQDFTSKKFIKYVKRFINNIN